MPAAMQLRSKFSFNPSRPARRQTFRSMVRHTVVATTAILAFATLSLSSLLGMQTTAEVKHTENPETHFVGLIPAPSSSNGTTTTEEKIKALIVDGQNNHRNWPQTTIMMKQYLLDTNIFEVDVCTTAPEGVDENFEPEFDKYDVVISNYNGAPWPQPTQEAFTRFVNNGGGLVPVHAADNAFPNWKQYNEMIGLGGWNGRNESSGPYVYYNQTGEVVRDSSQGQGGSHGAQHPFQVIVRNTQHPITIGLPSHWLHAKDELYDRLRGPAENMEVLATAYSAPDKGGSDRHEPMIMVLKYGQGRVCHLPMGHGNDSQECVGFITVFQRSCQWAATGKVTLEVPDDFPTADEVKSRPFDKEKLKPNSSN